jgi:hypothetical protein
MKATTIKLDGEILEEVKAAKPEGETLTGYVRSVLRREIERKKKEEAALAYRVFMEANREERQWLGEWESADLASPPGKEEAR